MEVSRPIVVPVGPEPRVDSDVIFRDLGDAVLKLDVYRSREVGDYLRPGVVLVYGDTDADRLRGARGWGQFRSWGTLLANEGFAAVVADHRSRFTAGLQGAAEDVAAALSFVRNRGTGFGIDTDRVAVFGISFGVPYQLWAVRNFGASIRGLVCYYGFMDLRGVENDLDEGPAEVAELSALKQVEDGETFPSMLIVRAGKDFEALNASIDSFREAAGSVDQELEVISIDEGQHAFDVLDDTDASRDAIWRTVDFLRARLA